MLDWDCTSQTAAQELLQVIVITITISTVTVVLTPVRSLQSSDGAHQMLV